MGPRAIILFFLVLISSSSVYAAACCGGGSALPVLITGDYKGQIVFTGANSAVTHDSNQNGKISERDGRQSQVAESVMLSAAYAISPLWQIGTSIPYKVNSHSAGSAEESSRGLGDIKLQIGYEFLPEYYFSLWKPRGFLFIEQTIANSSSTYDADKPLRSDSLGNGFYTTAFGVSFIKTIYSFDYLFMGEIHQGFKRRFDVGESSFTVKPSIGYSGLVGAGHNFSNTNLRLGGTILYSREGKRSFVGDISSISNSSHFWEVGISISYLINDLSFSLNYKDQSFLGKAINTPLSKSINASITKFIEL